MARAMQNQPRDTLAEKPTGNLGNIGAANRSEGFLIEESDEINWEVQLKALSNWNPY